MSLQGFRVLSCLINDSRGVSMLTLDIWSTEHTLPFCFQLVTGMSD